MEYRSHSKTIRYGWYRPAVTLAALCLLIVGATLFSGSFFKLSSLKDGEVFDASTASANSERAASIETANVNKVEDGARIISLGDSGFSPAEVTIRAGSTVAWVNNSGAGRIIQVMQPVFFGSAILQTGDTFQYLFNAPGTYAYKTADGAFSGSIQVVSPDASETTTTTTTPGATGTAGGTETTTPGSTGTTTPGATGTTTPGGTGTTTPGSTGTTTPGSTGTTTPGSTGTTTPGSTGTTTPGGTGTTTPGATGTTTGTPGPGCTPTGNVNVSIVSGGFNPSTININAATSVTWINNSGSRARIRDINHVLFDSGDIQAGGSWTYTFCSDGSFQYENSRGSGTGWVIVGTGGGGTSTPNPSGTTTPGGTGTTTPGSTGTTTPGSTGTTTPGSTGTTTPGSTGTTTPGSTGTTTPGTTGTTTPGSTQTTTPGSTGTTTPGTTATTTPGTTGTTTPGSTGTTTPGSTGTTTPGSTGTTTPGSTTTPGACVTGFTDVLPGSTFYEFVQCLACRNIIGGYSDGSFQPNNSITRGQIAKIVSNAAGFNDTPTGQTFSDVPIGHTFYVFIERMMMHGVLGGYSDGTFRPGNNATRGQIAKIVSNAAGFNDTVTSQTFADVVIGSTFYTFAERLAMRGIMSGYACGGAGEPCDGGNLPYFRPANDATRGQVAKIVSNTFFPNCTP